MRFSKGTALLSVIIGGALFALGAFVFGWGLVIGAIAGAGAMVVSYPVFAPQKAMTPGEKLLSAPRKGLRPDIAAALEEGARDIARLENTSRALSDTGMRDGVREIVATARRIVGYIQDNPGKLPVARRFFNYYLSAAADICGKYASFIKNGMEREQLAVMTEKTRTALATLREAFDKQYGRLLENDVMDIEADIALLRNTLEMEEK